MTISKWYMAVNARKGLTALRYHNLVVVDNAAFTRSYTPDDIGNEVTGMYQNGEPTDAIIFVQKDTEIRVEKGERFFAIRPNEWVKIVMPIRDAGLKGLATDIQTSDPRSFNSEEYPPLYIDRALDFCRRIGEAVKNKVHSFFGGTR